MGLAALDKVKKTAAVVVVVSGNCADRVCGRNGGLEADDD
jgi:hypothetical protein